jgi:hypothetical protein
MNKVRIKDVAAAFCCCLLWFCSSCESFLEVDLPKSKISRGTVYSTDATAMSAVTGIYNEMVNSSSFSSGANLSVTALAGLSSDDLEYVADLIPANTEFSSNDLTKENSTILNLWTSMYKIIYQSNAVLTGLDNSSSVTNSVGSQLRGEALFVRAFTHFYLVNMFGEVPIILSNDYQNNSSVSRSPIDDVYAQIIDDLVVAESLLSESYVSADRVRPNKFAATALLARVYLYLGNWAAAESASSRIIDSDLYTLEGIENVFLIGSREAIWQLYPKTQDGVTGCTNEGYFFSPLRVGAFNILSRNVISAFENGDRRETVWTDSLTSETGSVFYPKKYRQDAFGPMTEYSIVFRLAEQYLIRAESRVRQSNLLGAIQDVDSIRRRASLPLIQDLNPNISVSDLLLSLERERQLEFFSEWGHRWFDLKRTDRANIILSPLKSGWSNDDQLYPIPQAEFDKNPQLGRQNDGY